MVGCAYVAVPLYYTFCQKTGTGGTIQRKEKVEDKIARHTKEGTVAQREIVVQFNADVADEMQWKFKPTQREVRVKPGESALAFYTAENRSSTPITGLSTYNVTPHKLKTSCSDYSISDSFIILFWIKSTGFVNKEEEKRKDATFVVDISGESCYCTQEEGIFLCTDVAACGSNNFGSK